MTRLMKSMVRIRWPAALVALFGGVFLSIAVAWICLWFSPCSTGSINFERVDGRIRGWTMHPPETSVRVIELEPHQAAWPVAVPNDWPADPSGFLITRGVGVECISGATYKRAPIRNPTPPGVFLGPRVAVTAVQWGWPTMMFEMSSMTSAGAAAPSTIGGIIPDRFMSRPASMNPKQGSVQSLRVIWSGAVVNAALFAVLIAFTINAVRIGVRANRLRRGCCTRCGYRIVGWRCTECGLAAD